jgi:hypothetical protein
MSLDLEPCTYPLAPVLPEELAFEPTQRDVGQVLRRAGKSAGVAVLALAAFMRTDSAVTPIWEAGLGRPDATVEHIVDKVVPTDTLVTIATTPGFNANYDDMAQTKKPLAEAYNTRLVFARNGNKAVQPETIASLLYDDMPKQRKGRLGEYTQSSMLILDGHSMGGKVALWVAAWFVEHHPEIQLCVVLDSTPNSIADVQGLAAQTVVRGLSVGAPKKGINKTNFTIGPGTRFIAESANRLAEEPLRTFIDKNFVFNTLRDKFRNLGANNQPLSNTALSEQASIIDSPFPPELAAKLVAAGVNIIRLSPDLDTTVYNDPSVAGFSRQFGANFCNLPIANATHASPNERRSHDAYMALLHKILRDILGIQPRAALLGDYIGRITINPVTSALSVDIATTPLAQKCSP